MKYRYFDHWCGHGLQYLDDSQCAKKFPSKYDREWTCPVPVLQSAPEGFQADGPLSSMKVDTSTLAQIITDTDVNVCVVITKRVKDTSVSQGFKLYNKYLCAGDYSAQTPFETWSRYVTLLLFFFLFLAMLFLTFNALKCSSKIFAVANAAGHLRSNETKCGAGNAHNQLFGLDGSTTGKHGTTPFGDLATVICSYDTTAGYSSNSLSSYFHDIGWRDRIDDLVVNWLGKSDQSLGGNYGEATPSDLGFTATTYEDSSSNSTCAVDKDPWPKVYSNSISALSAAEMTRRIALHREVDSTLRFPGATWTDMQTLLYGAEKSALFPGLQWGGMTTDTAVFVQSSEKMAPLLQDTQSNKDLWRIFSKLGKKFLINFNSKISLFNILTFC